MGVFGVSLGGYYAARAAAYEPRVRAAVDLAGPYRFDLDWDELAPQTRTTFQARSGAASPAQARERAAALTLEDAAARITCPLLVVHGGRDRLIPAYHAERLAREAPGAELMLYPDGSHGVTNHAFESRAEMADWLAARLELRYWLASYCCSDTTGRWPPCTTPRPVAGSTAFPAWRRTPARLGGGAPDRRDRLDSARPGRFRRPRHRDQRSGRPGRARPVPGAAGLSRPGWPGSRPVSGARARRRASSSMSWHTAWDRPGGVANRSGAGDLDVVIYSARKWARLALAGNPTVLLVLFVPDEEVVFRNEAGAELTANAHRFVSRLAAGRYLGYLKGQKAAMTGRPGAYQPARAGGRPLVRHQVRHACPEARAAGGGIAHHRARHAARPRAAP